jgi:rhodanese-related sulfurtransferase
MLGKNRRKFIVVLRWGIPAILLGIVLFLLLGRTGSFDYVIPMEISAFQTQTEFQRGAILLDVREQNEYKQAHVAGSTLIPLGVLSARTQELPRDRLIIVMCRSGARSARGRDTLRAAGFSQVTSLGGCRFSG